MVRVFRRPGSASARRAPTRAAKRKAQKHKVVMESITQEKKKLRSVISFESKAPPGYTFISAGNPRVTNACKELCRKDGLKIFAVTTTPHMHTHNLSQHVHRTGFHFPSAIVATVCMDLGLYLTTTGKVVPIRGVGGNIRPSNADQITINTEARDALRDLFPNIPDNDLNQIIKTAFQKGQRKVGTALELPLARRAQLAVVAHIRHVYTDYDRLLKVTSFHEARSIVEEPTLAKLVEWRGDDENGKTVLEDVFREVIVISDDDENSDSDEAENTPSAANRDHSVEYVSSRARAVELPARPLAHANPTTQQSLRELSADEAPPGFRVIPQVPKKNKIDRRGFSRYQAWDRALNRYRNLALNPMRNQHVHSLPEPSRQRYPDVVKLPDAMPLKRAPAIQDEYSFQQHGFQDVPVLLNGSQEVRDGNESRFGQQSRVLAFSHNRTSDAQDRALPSIENPSPQEIRRPSSGRLDGLSKRITGGLSICSVTPQRLPYPADFQLGYDDPSKDHHSPKRRRVAHYGPVYGNSHPGNAHGAVESVVSSVLKGTSTGQRYMPCGAQSSVQDDSHVRRKYVAPVDQPSAEQWPQRPHNSPVHATQGDPNSNPFMDRRRIDDRVSGHAAYRQNPEFDTRPPGQSYAFSSVPGHAITVDENSDPRASRVHPGDHSYSGDRLRPLEMPASQASVWRGPNNERLLSSQDISHRRKHYADDFVRPVGFGEPEPLEYATQRPRIQTRRIAESFSNPARVRIYDDKQRYVNADARAPTCHSHQPRLDYQTRPSHEYATLDGPNRVMHHGSRLYESSVAPRFLEQRYAGPLDSTRSRFSSPSLSYIRANDHRPVHNYYQHMPYPHDPEHPSYVRREVRQPVPPRAVPDSRPIVIVD